jgi:hypothetical protein
MAIRMAMSVGWSANVRLYVGAWGRRSISKYQPLKKRHRTSSRGETFKTRIAAAGFSAYDAMVYVFDTKIINFLIMPLRSGPEMDFCDARRGEKSNFCVKLLRDYQGKTISERAGSAIFQFMAPGSGRTTVLVIFRHVL